MRAGRLNITEPTMSGANARVLIDPIGMSPIAIWLGGAAIASSTLRGVITTVTSYNGPSPLWSIIGTVDQSFNITGRNIILESFISVKADEALYVGPGILMTTELTTASNSLIYLDGCDIVYKGVSAFAGRISTSSSSPRCTGCVRCFLLHADFRRCCCWLFQLVRSLLQTLILVVRPRR